MSSSSFMSSWVEILFSGWIEDVENFPAKEAKAAILVLRSARKSTNSVEGLEILLPVKFRWIPVSGFRGKVENTLANQRSWQPSWFSDRPERHKLGRGRWDLFPAKFRWIPFSGFRGEVENVSDNQRPGRPSWFSDRPEQFVRGCWYLAFYQISLNSAQRMKMSRTKSQPIRGQGGHLDFPIGPKNLLEDVDILLSIKFRWILPSGWRCRKLNPSQSEVKAAIWIFRSARKSTNLVEGVAILLPVKFRWIPFSCFRWEFETVSANQRSWQSSWVFRSERKTRSRFLPSFVEFCSAVSKEKSKMSQQVRGQGGHPDFPNGPKKHELGRGRSYLASSQVSLNSFRWLKRRLHLAFHPFLCFSHKMSQCTALGHMYIIQEFSLI